MEGGHSISLTELLMEMKEAQLGHRWSDGVRGRKDGRHMGRSGRPCGYRLDGDMRTDRIHFPATIRAASVGQAHVGTGTPAVCIERQDMRFRRLLRQERMGILFVVDASRSQGAYQRLAFAKGAVLSLLRQVYTRRDKAGLIVFGDRRAELVLPFTKSVEFAASRLRVLPAAGNTPLGMGLRKALETVAYECRRDGTLVPLLVVITDGKVNYDVEDGQPLDLALKAAGQVCREGIPAVVIDTERGVFRMGLAQKVAHAMGAKYLQLGV